MRTLQHHVEAGEAQPYEGRIVYPDGTSVPHFRCRCGQRVPLDMVLDLDPEETGGVPTALRGADRFRCATCVRRWIYRGDISADEMRRLTGQPPRSNPRQGW